MLAAATVYGLQPLDVVRASPIERRLLLELAPDVIKAGRERDNLLANRIIYELGEAMKKAPKPKPVFPDG